MNHHYHNHVSKNMNLNFLWEGRRKRRKCNYQFMLHEYECVSLFHCHVRDLKFSHLKFIKFIMKYFYQQNQMRETLNNSGCQCTARLMLETKTRIGSALSHSILFLHFRINFFLSIPHFSSSFLSSLLASTIYHTMNIHVRASV